VRRWVLDRQAEADLQVQLDYLMERGAVDAAEQLSARVKVFLRDFLTVHPRTGIFLDHRGLWENMTAAHPACCVVSIHGQRAAGRPHLARGAGPRERTADMTEQEAWIS